jgi:two-component system nitrogen regulation response regulator NtrX
MPSVGGEAFPRNRAPVGEEWVLIVDDEEQVRRLFERILRTNGHPCLMAASADDARAQLGSAEIALLVCDVDLGSETGLNLVREARMSHPDLAVLMASGHDDLIRAKAASDAGAYGYLVKPFGAGQLLIAVENALHHRRLEREKRRYQVELEWAVDERTSQLQVAVNELRVSREQTVKALARARPARTSRGSAQPAPSSPSACRSSRRRST